MPYYIQVLQFVATAAARVAYFQGWKLEAPAPWFKPNAEDRPARKFSKPKVWH